MESLRRKAASVVLLIVGGFGIVLLVGMTYGVLTKKALFQLVLAHFAAIIGLPGAAVAAAAVVIFLEYSVGPMEFEGLGFKFKGASGPVVLWVFCFLAIAAAIKLLW